MRHLREEAITQRNVVQGVHDGAAVPENVMVEILSLAQNDNVFMNAVDAASNSARENAD
jgi:hypothetical protein